MSVQRLDLTRLLKLYAPLDSQTGPQNLPKHESGRRRTMVKACFTLCD